MFPGRPAHIAADASRHGRRALAAGLLGFAALALGSCSTLPQTKPWTGPVPARELSRHVTVRGPDGPLAESLQRRAIERLASAAKGDLATYHLRVLAAVQGEVNLYPGNAARLLVDGPATFAAMKAAISGARHRVLIESYIIDDADVAREIGELLASKVAQGVPVALLYDALGSRTTDPAFFETLRARGIAVCAFNPVNPVQRPGYWGINHRNHRKVVVVDAATAFTGGINISQVYSSGSFGSRRSARDADAPDNGWRDTQIELQGPVVAALAGIFERTWNAQGCHGTPGVAPRAKASRSGDKIVKILTSDPDQGVNEIYGALLAAVRAAQRSVHLTMAYFAPGAEMVDALGEAARRGVDVVLILPGRSDFELVLHAGRSYYEQLLEAGVVIHETDHAIMHAKTAVIDGVLSTVGSSNMDWRSFVDNSELNAIVIDAGFGAEMEALFRRDRSVSRLVETQAWRERGWRQRLFEWVGRFAERWL
ncbi:MAG: cardiolipin synthase B [Burkholderiaceae bacterium]|nr:cardiolipin synthase B [Burkholderiaceae bacterium]